MGERLGSTIGGIGGLLFVLVNAGAVGAPTATVLRVVAVAGGAAALAKGAVGAAWTAVAAGVVLLVFSAAGVLVDRANRHSLAG